MAALEFEAENDDGFVFKVRKRHLEYTSVSPLDTMEPLKALVKERHSHEDPEPVAGHPCDLEKKAKRLLTLKEMYEAELEAWKKLEAAAVPLVFEEPLSNSDTPLSSPEQDPHAEFLKELKIEVENMEEYIKRLQDHIVLAESTYKLRVKEMREDANFRPADQIVLALTDQATSDVDVLATQGSLSSSASLNDL
ncbi:uncharacterized protein [Physcomitrium patens]|uniref:Uncharacterized protein n=1 Tax=Physcomitrium patens TaxID=3218 RepID=A0A2K1KXC9_PHYPA|nr:uncharacterized protein LOC112279671 [Physcomitrium patens]PNR58419.1 hypothetical protein PHYPA_005414 [Physcomitrium patens]|eukprot:XP_024370085.1 uncharacterized protein LOC112279671 [Physcomitrella patens]